MIFTGVKMIYWVISLLIFSNLSCQKKVEKNIPQDVRIKEQNKQFKRHGTKDKRTKKRRSETTDEKTRKQTTPKRRTPKK